MNKVKIQNNIGYDSNTKLIDIVDNYALTLMKYCIENSISCEQKTMDIYCDVSYLKDIFKNEKNYTINGSGPSFLITFSHGCENTANINYIKYNKNINAINIFGSEGFLNYVSDIVNNLNSKFKKPCYIRWYMCSGDKVDWSIFKLDEKKLPITEMYPFLTKCTLQDYYFNFTKNESNILILIGPPGVGKTSFIKGYIEHFGGTTYTTNDMKVINDDKIYSDFFLNRGITNDRSLLIIEDADTILKSRESGNTLVSKFLNMGDGLISNKNKKIIFSTNLANIRDLDKALVRVGRCFDIINFTPLNLEQANILCKIFSLPELTEEKTQYTLTEVFNREINNSNDVRFGFNQ